MAPYEADAQLAFLARSGFVDLVLSEDSDLLAFKTPILLTKFDHKGTVYEYQYEKVVKFLDMTYDEFLNFCILLGCDYMDKIGKVGAATARKLVSDYSTMEKLLKKL